MLKKCCLNQSKVFLVPFVSLDWFLKSARYEIFSECMSNGWSLIVVDVTAVLTVTTQARLLFFVCLEVVRSNGRFKFFVGF